MPMFVVNGEVTVSASVIVKAETAEEAIARAPDVAASEGFEIDRDGEPSWKEAHIVSLFD